MHSKQILGTTAALAALQVSQSRDSPASAGVSGPAFYVDHVLYRTVATPTDLSGTGGPGSQLRRHLRLRRCAAQRRRGNPGYRDYNGGRWQVHAVSLPNGYDAALASGDLDHDGVLDALDEVMAAISAGDAVDTGVVQVVRVHSQQGPRASPEFGCRTTSMPYAAEPGPART